VEFLKRFSTIPKPAEQHYFRSIVKGYESWSIPIYRKRSGVSRVMKPMIGQTKRSALRK
jgi:hypothetical protein